MSLAISVFGFYPVRSVGCSRATVVNAMTECKTAILRRWISSVHRRWAEASGCRRCRHRRPRPPRADRPLRADWPNDPSPAPLTSIQDGTTRCNQSSIGSIKRNSFRMLSYWSTWSAQQSSLLVVINSLRWIWPFSNASGSQSTLIFKLFVCMMNRFINHLRLFSYTRSSGVHCRWLRGNGLPFSIDPNATGWLPSRAIVIG